MFRLIKLFGLLIFIVQSSFAQTGSIAGRILSENKPLESVTIKLNDQSTLSDRKGNFAFENLPFGEYTLNLTAIGFQPLEKRVVVDAERTELQIELTKQATDLGEVVVTGTMKPVRRSESPVPVEVYTPQFFKKNPTPSIFESLQNVNGVRPQLNCNVCNTGDIHINGLEGPYTMVTIDGMPIVSSLATVYGLFGIPNQLIERMEIVKGPASSLYGSEAVGGLINIITKNPTKAPAFTMDVMGTSWQEFAADLGVRFNAGKKVYSLLGVNYFNYQRPEDRNHDNFTDVTLQHRVSVFNKWSWQRKENRAANIAWRYFYEDRWGGDMRWSKKFRGTDSLYGESIYTSRVELLGNYELPLKEKIVFSFSYNSHDQNSFYGIMPFTAKQHIAFNQLTWDRNFNGVHDVLAGVALRYTYYDDNSTATLDTASMSNQPDKILLPGLFVQDEIRLSQSQKLLLGFRYDHHNVHGNIFTPRVAYKLNIDKNNIIRLNAGTGFRVVNLFTEDHAALTGARDVVIEEDLRPEQSYNVNINYTGKIPMNESFAGIDLSAWYTHFTNQILPDYNTDPNQIRYTNLDGYATSKGISLNFDLNIQNRLTVLAGATFQDVSRIEKENGKSLRIAPPLTEKWSGTWSVSYSFPRAGLTFDYTGNVYGPMDLPLAGPLDPRPARSKVWSIQNIQCTGKLSSKWELYGGVKNLLNWTPAKSLPFLIARSHDPFDKQVSYDAEGKVLATPDNPYALTFDPTYVYAPNQGIRVFMGVRFVLK